MAIKLRYIRRHTGYDTWFKLGEIYSWDGTKEEFLRFQAYGINDDGNGIIGFKFPFTPYNRIFAARFELVNDKLDPRLG